MTQRMVSARLAHLVAALPKLRGSDLKVAVAYLHHADHQTGDAYPSITRLCQLVGTRKRERIVESIRKLEELGLIETGEKRPGRSLRRRVCPRARDGDHSNPQVVPRSGTPTSPPTGDQPVPEMGTGGSPRNGAEPVPETGTRTVSEQSGTPQKCTYVPTKAAADADHAGGEELRSQNPEPDEEAITAAVAQLRRWGLRKPSFIAATKLRAFVEHGGELAELEALRDRAADESTRGDPMGLLWDWLGDASTCRDVMLDFQGDAKHAGLKRAHSVDPEAPAGTDTTSPADVMDTILSPVFGEVGG